MLSLRQAAWMLDVNPHAQFDGSGYHRHRLDEVSGSISEFRFMSWGGLAHLAQSNSQFSARVAH